MMSPEPSLALDEAEEAGQNVVDLVVGVVRSYVRGLAAVVKMLLRRPDVPQLLMLLSVLGYAAQLTLGPSLVRAGARVASHVREGEVHRLFSSLFLHADPLHLYKCVFGLSRLAPSTAAVYGGAQCVLIFLLSGACGNLAALRLDALAPHNAPAMGASGALLGLDGALLAYGLRHRREGSELGPALRRTAITLGVACVRPWLGPRAHRIDHAAHLGGDAARTVQLRSISAPSPLYLRSISARHTCVNSRQTCFDSRQTC